MAFPFEYPPDVATLLAQLCCHRNQLPQGAPTSPMISNYICRRLDIQLAALARAERCYYTRYADDLCFSTDRGSFPQSLARVETGRSIAGPAIVEVVSSNGFTLNEAKTRLMRQNQRQRVTGLVVNEKVNVSSNYVRQLKGLLYIWKRHGEAAAIEAMAHHEGVPNWPPEKAIADLNLRVRGRVQHVGAIKGWSSPTYQRLASLLSDLDPTFVRRAAPAGKILQAQLFTEGLSDGHHIKAAHRYYVTRGDFTDLSLDIQVVSDLHGDDALLKRCKMLSQHTHAVPCVYMFDGDSQRIIKEAGGDGRGWKNWGKGVVSVVLAPPPWRAEERVCIELLYDDEVLRSFDSKGRRLFLSEEFNLVTGHHSNEPYTTPHSRRDSLVCEEVHTKADGKSIGLSKVAFAELIAEGQPGFADPDFEGFRETFSRLRKAIAEATEDIK